MEGLIPFVYKAIVQYKNGGLLLTDQSPSASYMRLPGDSGRFQILQSHLGVPSSSWPSAATKRSTLSSGVLQSPGVHFTSHRACY